MKYLEIGVAQGEHAQKLLNQNPNLIYTGIDQWLYDPEMEHEPNKIKNWNSQEKWDQIYQMVLDKLKPYKERATILRGNSREILPTIKEKFDYIYVDGDHSAEGAYQDIKLSIEVLAKGGIIEVDDLNFSSVKSGTNKFLTEFSEYKIIGNKITKK